MATYRFTVVLAGLSEIPDDLAKEAFRPAGDKVRRPCHNTFRANETD